MNTVPQNEYTSNYFNARFTPDASRDTIWKEICRYLQERYITPEAHVLDMGAGYCSFINHIAAGEKHALDLNPQIAEFAAADVQTHIGPCTDLQAFSDNTLDVVFSSNLLEHLTRDEIETVMAEVQRTLKPGGRFIIIQPNFRYCYREYFDDYTHLQVFTHVGLTDWLVARGFQIEQVVPRFLPFSFKSRLPKWRILAWLYLRLPYRPLGKQMLIVARWNR